MLYKTAVPCSSERETLVSTVSGAAFMMKFLCLLMILGLPVFVQCKLTAPEGYSVDHETGKAYKLMYHALTWDQARLKCLEEGAKLAVPKSEKEFNFLQTIVRGMQYHQITGTDFKLVVWLGISNLDDYTVWVNVDGEAINDTGFHQWAEGNGGLSNNPKEPHCAVMDALNVGLRDFWCHRAEPFICETTSTSSPQ